MSGIIGKEPFGKSGVVGAFTSVGIDDNASSATAITIASNGVVTTVGDLIPGADIQLANGRGISFSNMPNAAGMSSELLDDYEEGTWDADGNGISISETAANYTKVGRMVTITIDTAIPVNGSSSSMQITGVPFTSVSDGSLAQGYTDSGVNDINWFVQGTTIYVYTTSGSAVANSNFSNKTLRLTGTFSATS